MDSYGYISAIALFIYVAMMLIFLAAKKEPDRKQFPSCTSFYDMLEPAAPVS